MSRIGTTYCDRIPPFILFQIHLIALLFILFDEHPKGEVSYLLLEHVTYTRSTSKFLRLKGIYSTKVTPQNHFRTKFTASNEEKLPQGADRNVNITFVWHLIAAQEAKSTHTHTQRR